MTAAVTVLTPVDRKAPISLGNRTWRKQILPIGSLNYMGRKLEFTKDYLQGLALAFKDKAFDAVPLQLADRDNAHTNDPERTRAKVIDMQLSEDGLDAIVTGPESSAQLFDEWPELGVSVSIVEDYERGDGKKWPAAIQHVLATWDPRVTGMKPWEAINCANESGGKVIDLSEQSFANSGDDDEKNTESPDERGTGMTVKKADPNGGQLTEEEVARFRQWMLEQNKNDDSDNEDEEDTDEDGATDEVDVDEDGDFTDEELDIIAAQLVGKIGANVESLGNGTGEEVEDAHDDTTRQLIAASNENNEALQLANARLESQAIELARIRKENDRRAYEQERDELARNYGLPPRIVDLARPLLEGQSKNVELSNGTKADPGKVMRNVLKELGRTFKALDLSNETGSAIGLNIDSATEEAKERDAFLDRVRAQGN